MTSIIKHSPAKTDKKNEEVDGRGKAIKAGE